MDCPAKFCFNTQNKKGIGMVQVTATRFFKVPRMDPVFSRSQPNELFGRIILQGRSCSKHHKRFKSLKEEWAKILENELWPVAEKSFKKLRFLHKSKRRSLRKVVVFI